jgi:hypothetical protein
MAKGNHGEVIVKQLLEFVVDKETACAIILELSSYRSVAPARPSCFCVVGTTQVRS